MNGMGSSAICAVVQERVLQGLLRTVDYTPTAFDGVALPTSGANDTLVIDSEAAFLCYAVHGAAFSSGPTFAQFPAITVNLRNSGSGRYLSQEPFSWVTMIGNAQYPYYLPEPWFLPATSNLAIALSNFSGSQYANVYMTFIGVKLFPQNGYDISELAAPGGQGMPVTNFNYS